MRNFTIAIVLILGLALPMTPALAGSPAPAPPTSLLQPHDKVEFDKLIAPDAKLVKIAGDGAIKFSEGPVWVPAGGYLLFSDVQGDTIFKWQDGALTPYRTPSHNANGNQLDAEGHLVTCEHGSHSVTRAPIGGPSQTLVSRYQGKRLNSPNDLAIRSDGTIWFTDPPFGLGGRPRELYASFVFRYDPKTKALNVVTGDIARPNGLCFSPDEKILYVANSEKNAEIFAFDIQPDGTPANRRVFCKLDSGAPDGMRVDAAGRLWTSAGDGVHIFSPAGERIGKILVQPTPTNLCFGGKDGKTLFITARTEVYSIQLR